MGLKCKDCGSRNTKIVEKKDLKDAAKQVGASVSGASGYIDPDQIRAVLKVIAAIFEWLTSREDGKKPVLVCKDCGYYEKI